MPTSLSSPLSNALAETIATGASLKPRARMRRIVSQPSMPGIARSIRIASGLQSRQQREAFVARRGLRNVEAERLEHVDEQLAVDLLVVDHEHAAPLADVADALRARQLALGQRGAHLGQEQADAEQRAAAAALLLAPSSRRPSGR